MNAMFGWRARLGVLVPSINKTMEPELYKMAPAGVSVHFSRLRQREDTVEELQRMADDIPRAAAELADAEVDVIAFGCTSGSLIGGPGYDQQLIKKIESVAHIPAITTSTAVISALKELGIKTLCVATPYIDAVNEREKQFLVSDGFKILNMKGLGCKGPETADLSPKLIYKHAKSVFRPGADGLFMSCTDLRTSDILEVLEHDLNKPVVSSNQATMWMMLKSAGIGDPIEGYGTLLTRRRISE
jgi:maleate isomerase